MPRHFLARIALALAAAAPLAHAAPPIVFENEGGRWETSLDRVIVKDDVGVVFFEVAAKSGGRKGGALAILPVSECSKVRGTITVGFPPYNKYGYADYAFDKQGQKFIDAAGVATCMALVQKLAP
ncbi:hypothetical protein [Chitiniphilus eburneus]|uniref:Uncharacterized protein n=1 Tax=Chitiniphilus eburneus TaxID=2571148 RepID=A0A4U0PCA2_9NEIS|nr:hypothetical protein [Chitiniphilus eburneus]TJZ65365.1 hypothetical protein FAZ21_18240 [Chitiniphilus eburneus]